MKAAQELHKNVPPDWYFKSIKRNPFQRYWHKRRFEEVSEVIGIDALKGSIAGAKKHWAKNRHLKFQTGDAHNLNFLPGTLDAVFALEVLEHLHNPEKVLAEVKRVLKKGGYGVLLVRSDSFLFRLIWFLAKISWAKIWENTHIQTFRNERLIKISQKQGFDIEVDRKFLLGMLHLVKVRKV